MTETPAVILTAPPFFARSMAAGAAALLLWVAGADPGRAQDVYIEAERGASP